MARAAGAGGRVVAMRRGRTGSTTRPPSPRHRCPASPWAPAPTSRCEKDAGVTLVKGDLRGIVRARTVLSCRVRRWRTSARASSSRLHLQQRLGIPIAAGVLYPFFQTPAVSPTLATAAMSVQLHAVIGNAPAPAGRRGSEDEGRLTTDGPHLSHRGRRRSRGPRGAALPGRRHRSSRRPATRGPRVGRCSASAQASRAGSRRSSLVGAAPRARRGRCGASASASVSSRSSAPQPPALLVAGLHRLDAATGSAAPRARGAPHAAAGASSWASAWGRGALLAAAMIFAAALLGAPRGAPAGAVGAALVRGGDALLGHRQPALSRAWPATIPSRWSRGRGCWGAPRRPRRSWPSPRRRRSSRPPSRSSL